MAEIPEGAQRSEDGHYWWDGSQWQLVDQSQAAAVEGDDERVQARVAAGLPGSLYDVSAEQRDQYLTEATVSVETEESEEVEVLAMQDAGGGSEGSYA